MVTMAFEIFPVEVWEVILDTLAAEDAYNTVAAFPDLHSEMVIRALLPKWLFYLVAHRICAYHPWLTRKDILSCRLVCRQWCEGIDRIVQYKPERTPYPYNTDTGVLPLLNGNPFQILRCNILGQIPRFLDIDGLEKFQATMDGDDRNPFLFRGLSLHRFSIDYEREIGWWRDGPVIGLAPFWSSSLSLLKSYGKHVWYLRILGDNNSNRTSIVRFILQSLHFTPNLKALKIHIYVYEYENMNQILEELSGSLPDLPQLEFIDIIAAPEMLANCLFFVYGRQLKKITIAPEHWRQYYARAFPKLTDLRIIFGRIAEISKILTTIQSTLIAKLVISVGQMMMDCKYGNQGRLSLQSTIIPTLSRFPCLEYLGLYEYNQYCHYTLPKMGPTQDSLNHTTRIPSIRSFCMRSTRLAMYPELLICFPNLQNLEVHLRLQAVHFYGESDFVWEVACPKLEFVSTFVNTDFNSRFIRCHHHKAFDRDYYNRKKAERCHRKSGKDNMDDTVLEGFVQLFAD